MFLGLVAILLIVLISGGGAVFFWRFQKVRVAREMALREQLAIEEESERVKIAVEEKKLADAFEREEAGRRIKPRSDNPSLERGLKLCEQGDINTGLLWLVRALEEAGNDAEMQRAIRLNLAAWGMSQEKGQTVCKHSSPISALAISSDGQKMLVGGHTGTTRIYDSDGKPSGEPILGDEEVTALAFDPDGKTILVATENGGLERVDRMTGKVTGTAPHVRGPVLAIHFTPTGQLARAGTDKEGIWLFDGEDGRWGKIESDAEKPIQCMTLSADGKRGLIGFYDGDVLQWDKQRALARIRQSEETGNDIVAFTKRRVRAVALNSDETLFVVGNHDKVRLVDKCTQIPVGARIVHEGGVTCAVFTPDGKSLLTAGTDGTVKRWSLPQPLDGELARLKLWVQVRAGKEIDAAGNVRPIDEATRNERQRQLGKMGGPPRS
jgi:WD40 repeat protein